MDSGAEQSRHTEPAVSILMPSYNPGDFILEAVEDALTQMRPDDELILQDGGSTDGTIEKVIARFGSSSQLKVESGPDGGQADALNLALARATGSIIGWLNADDRLYPGALDAVRAAWVRRPEVDLVYGSWAMVDVDGETIRLVVPREFTLSSLVRAPHIFSGTAFYRAECLRSSGGFDKDLHLTMDVDVLLRLAALGVTAQQIPEVLAGFRWHVGGKTGVMDVRILMEARKLRLRHTRGWRGRAEAELFSGVHLVAFLATPLRQARWYSRLRVRRSESRGLSTPESR